MGEKLVRPTENGETTFTVHCAKKVDSERKQLFQQCILDRLQFLVSDHTLHYSESILTCRCLDQSTMQTHALSLCQGPGRAA